MCISNIQHIKYIYKLVISVSKLYHLNQDFQYKNAAFKSINKLMIIVNQLYQKISNKNKIKKSLVAVISVI